MGGYERRPHARASRALLQYLDRPQTPQALRRAARTTLRGERERLPEVVTLDAGRDLDDAWPAPMADPKTAQALQTVARALSRLGRERARSGDITPQQAEALQLIAERGAISTSSLAIALGIDPSTASRNLAGLERAGFILRRRGAEDGRQTDVRLTPRGKRIADAVSTDWTLAFSSLLDRCPRPERQRIADTLELLARVLDGEATN